MADKNTETKDAGTDAAEAAPPKKGKLKGLLLIVAGLVAGGGGAAAWFTFMAPPNAAEASAPEPAPQADIADENVAFLKIDRIMVPMVDENRRLLGYFTVDLSLEVAKQDEPVVKTWIPAVRHEINIRFARENVVNSETPKLIDYEKAAALMKTAANAALGTELVRDVKIVSATGI